MRHIRWQLLIAVGGITLVVGLLLGQTPPPAASVPLPVVGGAYSEALIGSIQRLNPILDTYNQVDADINRLLYSGLVRFDPQGIPQPDLAASWAASADATLFTFILRQDATWHDGRPVVADDVIYTYSKFQDPDYPGPPDLQTFWQQIEIIRLDERSVQFQLPEPFAPFLDYLTVGLLPDHLLRGVSAGALIDHPFNLEPIGSGPFRFDRFLLLEGEIAGVSLNRFDGYYGPAPFLERFEFRCFPDTTSALNAYYAGEIQGLGTVDAAILPAVLVEPNLNMHTTRLPEIGLVFLNLNNPQVEFFADKELRQALLLAINRQWMADLIFNGQAVAASSPILPGTWAFASDYEPWPYDPLLAAKQLETLGWNFPSGAAPGSPEYIRSKDNQALGFELAYPADALHQDLAQLLQTSWAGVGVQVELVPVEPTRLLEDYLQPRAFQAVLTEITFSRYPDPDPYPFWHDTQVTTGQNYSGFADRNISIWLEQARTTPNLARRAEFYRSFQYRFNDQVPALLLYYPVYSYAVDARVLGVSVGPLFSPSERFSSISAWHLLARRSLENREVVVP